MEKRISAYPIESLILNRMSKRAMSGKPVERAELMRLFEAARWAPSAFNSQPWHFAYALKELKYWESFFNLLVPNNQTWAKNAGALIIVFSKEDFDKTGKPSRTHSYDTGSACQNLALQASAQGLVCHPFSGFDYDQAKTLLNLPNGYSVEVMFAIGHEGPIDTLPPDLQEREKPTDRKPLKGFVFEGTGIL